MASGVLQLRNLKKAFGNHQVLKGLTLDIPLGQITVIIGGSGTGKSVTLKHIIGLLEPDEGEVLLEGVNLQKLKGEALKKQRMRFGMLFQDAALFDSMNVFDNIIFPVREHRPDIKEEQMPEIVRKKLSQVKLKDVEKKYPSELSGGMRKRVGLARATVLNPEIVLYDEPTTGLDPQTTKAVDDLIVNMQQDLNATSIIISHDIPSALRIANQIAMLHDGRIVAKGTPKQFLESDNEIVRNFIDPALVAPKVSGRV